MSDNTIICSFCGKTNKEVAQIVKASEVAICNECVEMCRDIIGKARIDKADTIFIPDNAKKYSAPEVGQ